MHHQNIDLIEQDNFSSLLCLLLSFFLFLVVLFYSFVKLIQLLKKRRKKSRINNLKTISNIIPQELAIKNPRKQVPLKAIPALQVSHSFINTVVTVQRK